MGFYHICQFAYGYFIDDNEYSKITDQNNVAKISSSYLFHVKFRPNVRKIKMCGDSYEINIEKLKTFLDQERSGNGENCTIDCEVLRKYTSENATLVKIKVSKFIDFVDRNMSEGVKSFKKEEIKDDIVSLYDYDNLESVEAKFKEIESEFQIEHRFEPRWYVLKKVWCTL